MVLLFCCRLVVGVQPYLDAEREAAVSPMEGSEAALVSVNDAVEMALEKLAAMAVVTVAEPL